MLGNGRGGLLEKWRLSPRLRHGSNVDCRLPQNPPASGVASAGFLEPRFALESFAYVDRLFDGLSQ